MPFQPAAKSMKIVARRVHIARVGGDVESRQELTQAGSVLRLDTRLRSRLGEPLQSLMLITPDQMYSV